VKKRAALPSGYEKVSATLEAPVLRQIRERTTNVSGFLNEAAKRKLYFDMLRATDEELERMGVETDERFYRNLKKWIHGVDARKRARTRRVARPARSG
jgi:hypothetical protein